MDLFYYPNMMIHLKFSYKYFTKFLYYIFLLLNIKIPRGIWTKKIPIPFAEAEIAWN